MHRLFLPLILVTSIFGLSACTNQVSQAPTDAELTAVADTVLALETTFHRDFDATDCEAALSVVGDHEPVVAGGGTIIRTLPDLQQVCESIAAARSKAVLDVDNVAVHPLSRNAAYVVREGTYTEYNKAGEVGNSYYIIFTSIWHLDGDEWAMVHLHESWRDPEMETDS